MRRKYKNLPTSSLYHINKIKKHSLNGLFSSCPLHYWTDKATENTDKCEFHIFWSPIIYFFLALRRLNIPILLSQSQINSPTQLKSSWGRWRGWGSLDIYMENVPWGKKNTLMSELKKWQFCIWAFLLGNVNCKMCQLRFAPSLPAHVYLICSFVLLHIHTAISVNDVLELLLFPNSFSSTSQLHWFSGFSLCSSPLAWYSFWNSSFVKCYSEGL